jgi:hypothetical protein
MEKFFSQLKEIGWWGKFAALGFVASLIVVLSGPIRESMQLTFRPPDREVLSILSVDLFGEQKVNRVVKVRTPEKILIEVYGPLEDHSRKLIDTIEINDRHDGYYHLLGQAVNLALKDMDGDRRPEIVAPTYDANMMPHLNVFKYNKEIQRFMPYQGADH